MNREMTDETLADIFDQSCRLASFCDSDLEAKQGLLRGFANRILMEFGDMNHPKTKEALSIPFTWHKKDSNG